MPCRSVREMNVAGSLVAPADDRAVDALLPLGAHVEEAGAFRRAQPLVAVAGVEVGAERGEVEVDLRDRVRAVDDRGEPVPPCACATISSTGSSSAVSEVMCERKTARVRSVRCSKSSSTGART